MSTMSTSLTPEDWKTLFPLHSAISNQKDIKIIQIIREMHAQDHAIIDRMDSQRLTPVFVATVARNIHALRTLLELGAVSDLLVAQSERNETPLDALKQDMLLLRSRILDDMGLPWNGYPAADLICEYLLKQALHIPTLASSETEYVAKGKFGCTCGQCTDGWLSPKMRSRLSVVAKEHSNTLDEQEAQRALLNKSGSEIMESLEDIGSRVFPYAFRPRAASIEFWTTWCKVFADIYDILKSQGQIPTLQYISSLENGRDLIARGAQIEYALQELISMTRQGDISIAEIDSIIAEDLDENYPTCDNDLQFEFVKQMLGLELD